MSATVLALLVMVATAAGFTVGMGLGSLLGRKALRRQLAQAAVAARRNQPRSNRANRRKAERAAASRGWGR